MKTKVKRIKKNVDVRIYDVLTELYGSYKAQRKYKYIMLKCELESLKIA